VIIYCIAYARHCVRHWESNDEKHKLCSYKFPFAIASFLTC
jgi:hypothetical protein